MAPRSHLILPALAAITLALLTGCRATPADDPTTEPSTSPSASPTPTPSATPTAEPITIDCATLVPADTMYAFNPNFSLDDGFTPDAGTPAANAVAHDGLACRWLNQTSGDTIDISVASLDDASLEDLKNAAVTESTMVPTYGEEAYFSVKDGVGTAIVFDRSYWLVASSDYFFEPGDATEIIDAALTALP